uniref:Uncharacterized protein n=1 Tax=Parascaris equorum TaxID=6256 RepID=A0A914RXT8_PAREQ
METRRSHPAKGNISSGSEFLMDRYIELKQCGYLRSSKLPYSSRLLLNFPMF